MISHQEEINLEPQKYSMHLDPVSNMRSTEAIASYAFQQAAIIRDVLLRRNFALVK